MPDQQTTPPPPTVRNDPDGEDDVLLLLRLPAKISTVAQICEVMSDTVPGCRLGTQGGNDGWLRIIKPS